MKNLSKIKRQKRSQRHNRVRSRVQGVEERPRLSVFRSSKYIYAQVINDVSGKTLAHAQDLNEKEISKIEGKEFKGKMAHAYKVGQLVAKRALEKGIDKVMFDRGGYKYYGRVRAVAEGARDAGLKF